MPPGRKEYDINDLIGKGVTEFPRKVIGPMENGVEMTLGWVPYKQPANLRYGFADGYDEDAREQFEEVMKNHFHLDAEADPADALNRVILANGAQTNWNDKYREDLKAISAMPENKEKYQLREKAAKEYMQGLFYEFSKGGLAVILQGETQPRQVRYDPFKGHVILSKPFSESAEMMVQLEKAYDQVKKREVTYPLPHVRAKPSMDVEKPDPAEDPGKSNAEKPQRNMLKQMFGWLVKSEDEEKLKHEDYLRREAEYQKALKDYETNLALYQQEKEAYDQAKEKKDSLENEAQEEYDAKIDAINDSPEKKEYYENRFSYKYRFGASNWKDSVRTREPAELLEEKEAHQKRCRNYNHRKREMTGEAEKLEKEDRLRGSAYEGYPEEVQEELARIDLEEAEEIKKVIRAKSISSEEYLGYSLMQDFYKEAREKVLQEARQKPKEVHFDFTGTLSKGSKEQFSKRKLADRAYRKKLEGEAKMNGDKEAQTEERRRKLMSKSDHALAQEYMSNKGKTIKPMQPAIKV